LDVGNADTNTIRECHDVNLIIKVFFQGVVFDNTSDLKDSYKTMNAAVTVKNEEGTTVYTNTSLPFTASSTIDSANGKKAFIWSGTALIKAPDVTKKIVVYIKGPKHIRKKICDNKPTESAAGKYTCSTANIELSAGEQTVDFTNITLLAGDLNLTTTNGQDGVADAVDAAYIINHNNISDSTDASVVAIGDINLDGGISAIDWSLLNYTFPSIRMRNKIISDYLFAIIYWRQDVYNEII
jgi:hypothetical protein